MNFVRKVPSSSLLACWKVVILVVPTPWPMGLCQLNHSNWVLITYSIANCHWWHFYRLNEKLAGPRVGSGNSTWSGQALVVSAASQAFLPLFSKLSLLTESGGLGPLQAEQAERATNPTLWFHSFNQKSKVDVGTNSTWISQFRNFVLVWKSVLSFSFLVI